MSTKSNKTNTNKVAETSTAKRGRPAGRPSVVRTATSLSADEIFAAAAAAPGRGRAKTDWTARLSALSDGSHKLTTAAPIAVATATNWVREIRKVAIPGRTILVASTPVPGDKGARDVAVMIRTDADS